MKNLITLTNGERLRIFRKLAGMDLSQLARATNMDAAYTGEIERGDTRMTPLSAMRFSEVLGCEVEDLLIESHKWAIDAKKIKSLPIMQKYSIGEISKITGVVMSEIFHKGVVEVDRKTVEKLALALCEGEVELILAD